MRDRQGQSTAEYAIVLGVVLAAIVAMQIYLKRGAQAQVKLGVDEFRKAGTEVVPWLDATAEQLTGGDVVLRHVTDATKRPGHEGQYEPYYAESQYRVTQESTTQEDVDLPAGTITRTIAETEKERTKRITGGYQKQQGTTTAD